MTQPPLVIVEAVEQLAAVAADLERAGWHIRHGWTLPDAPWHVGDERAVCVGIVDSEQDARQAVLVAARGAGILAAPGEGGFQPAFLADLGRLGTVDHRPPRGAPLSILDADQVALLEALAGGLVVPAAARRAKLSLRGAERKLAAARLTLGARTTAEAVVSFVQLRDGATSN